MSRSKKRVPSRRPSTRRIWLMTVRGADKPGITAKLTQVLAKAKGVRLMDIEQTIVHRKLILSMLLEFSQSSAEPPVTHDLRKTASRIGVDLEFERFDPRFLDGDDGHHLYVVTCIGVDVGAKPIHRIGEFLAKRDVNIDKIARLTTRGLSCVEMIAHARSDIDPKRLSRDLLALSSDLGVDVAVQRFDVSRRAKRVIVFDMDSTLITGEVIDELAKEAGVGKKVSAITRSAMAGNVPFDESLRQRVMTLKGLDEKSLDRVAKRMTLTKGTGRLIHVLKRLGFKTGVISGGFTFFTDHVRETLGLDYAFANRLEIKSGRLTGRLVGPIINEKQKATILELIAQSEGVSLDQTIAVGDGANDVAMLAKAGLGIAFHAHDVVKKQSGAAISSSSTGLDAVLYLLGISDYELKRI